MPRILECDSDIVSSKPASVWAHCVQWLVLAVVLVHTEARPPASAPTFLAPSNLSTNTHIHPPILSHLYLVVQLKTKFGIECLCGGATEDGQSPEECLPSILDGIVVMQPGHVGTHFSLGIFP